MESEQGLSVIENGVVKLPSSRDMRQGRTAHNMSSSSLRKKSDLTLLSNVRFACLRLLLVNVQEVILGTKLWILFPAIPFAILAHFFSFSKQWVFTLSLIGLVPLAERLSFITEQIAYFTGPTVGGLVNATCGNATEVIIAIVALGKGKIDLVKYSLMGSVLSNLLLVLGSSLFIGGIVNLKEEQKYDQRQAEVNSHMLLLALLCHSLPMLFAYAEGPATINTTGDAALRLSRASSVVMLVAYLAYLVFQLWTHRSFFEAEEDEDNGDFVEEGAAIGIWSGVAWLTGMAFLIALLSEYVVATIEEASLSWGLSVGFLSIILLPIVGNAAEHAGAVIFASRNKLDITLGVALGSATQIAMFVVPLCVIAGWIMGVNMDLDFNLLETASLALSVMASSSILQNGTSHYIKGLLLVLFYIVIAACFFFITTKSMDDMTYTVSNGLAS